MVLIVWLNNHEQSIRGVIIKKIQLEKVTGPENWYNKKHQWYNVLTILPPAGVRDCNIVGIIKSL